MAMRSAWFIAVHDFLHQLRQRETLLWAFLVPVLLFYFIGTITAGGGFGGRRVPLAVKVPADAGFLADELLVRLGQERFDVLRFDESNALLDTQKVTLDEGQSPPVFGDYSRRLVVPPGFTASVLAAEASKLTFEHDEEGQGADLDRYRLTRAAYTVLADVIAASGADEGSGAALATLRVEDLQALQAVERTLTLDVSTAGQRRRIPQGFEQAVPGTMVVFALLVVLTAGGTALVIERRSGLLRRLASAPIGRGSVVLGKWGGKFALAALQIGFALLLGRFVFGVDWGPQLPMLVLTLLAYTALLASLGILAGNWASTEGQAVAVGVLASNVLGALGGCWWPIEVTPPYMQTLALFLPTGWMMDAMHKLVVFQQSWRSALPHLAGMLVAAWVLGLVCARRFRFQ
jgi:ABC-type Na+ efflux pump permease subunit